MAYARFSRKSDVYVYASKNGWICASCDTFSDLSGLKKHLLKHRKRGDRVPQDALDAINAEMKGDTSRG